MNRLRLRPELDLFMPDIKSVILSNCRDKWQKVARVVWRSHNELSLPDDDESYALVEQELKALVGEGALEIAGDLSRWRDSEVRLVKY